MILWNATVPTDAEVKRIPRVSNDRARETISSIGGRKVYGLNTVLWYLATQVRPGAAALKGWKKDLAAHAPPPIIVTEEQNAYGSVSTEDRPAPKCGDMVNLTVMKVDNPDHRVHRLPLDPNHYVCRIVCIIAARGNAWYAGISFSATILTESSIWLPGIWEIKKVPS